MSVHEITLYGCTPVPLAGYLKALGILRIVSSQADKNAQGWWARDVFHLRSLLDAPELTAFFQEKYSPTPLVAPWNGGSGFFSKDNTQAIDALAASAADRFLRYRTLIGVSRVVLESLGLSEKPDTDAKAVLLQSCRNAFPDDSLDWLDAAYILTSDGAKYPPLLGTGGNDGRLEFTNNYMQRLTELFDIQTGSIMPTGVTPLTEAIFGVCAESRSKAAIGQFDPGSAGGANASGGYDGSPTMNVWDFILMLEGAIAFAGSSVRKLEQATGGSLSYPFCVRPAGIGYGSSDFSDEASSRSEMWMPLWNRPATFDSVSHLLSEGRVDIGHRRARNGVDFARAVASVGVDRGLDAFQRFGFQQRNGLAYFAVPLGRFEVSSPSGMVSLIGCLDNWLDRFRRTATGKTATAQAAMALRQVESAIIEVCQHSYATTNRSNVELLNALGSAEATIAASPKLREADYPVPPVPLLSSDWLRQCYDSNSSAATEFRLAAALASVGFRRNSVGGPMRQHMEPIDVELLSKKYARAAWASHANDPAIVWSGGSLVRNLIAILQRRLIDVTKSSSDGFVAPVSGCCPARLDDIAKFIDGKTDDRLLESLLRGLILIDWNNVAWKDIHWMNSGEKRDWHLVPSAAWCLLKLCLLPHGIPATDGSSNMVDVKLQPQMFRRAASGQLSEATQLAARRLTASGLRPAVEMIHAGPDIATRTTAALMFPIYGDLKRKHSDITRIRDRVLLIDDVEHSSVSFSGEVANNK